jgi:hypothetical protein
MNRAGKNTRCGQETHCAPEGTMNNPILEMRDVSKSFFGCVLSTLPSMPAKSTLIGRERRQQIDPDEDPIGHL